MGLVIGLVRMARSRGPRMVRWRSGGVVSQGNGGEKGLETCFRMVG